MLVLQALNFMPVGRLDGGRASFCVLGRQGWAVVGTVVLLAQALSGLAGDSPIQLFWGIIIILFQRSQDIPAQDEVSEVGQTRESIFAVLTLLTLLSLCPVPADFLTGAAGPDPFAIL